MAKERSSVHFDTDNLQFSGVDDVLIRRLMDSYPGVDVPAEIRRMCLWLSLKGRSRKGNLSFIMNWLKNCKPEIPVIETAPVKSPLDDLLKEYRKDLWKNRDYLKSLTQERQT